MKMNKKIMIVVSILMAMILLLLLSAIISRNQVTVEDNTDVKSDGIRKNGIPCIDTMEDNTDVKVDDIRKSESPHIDDEHEEIIITEPLSLGEYEMTLTKEKIFLELRPMSDITPGMPLEELKGKYPDKGFTGFGAQCAISSNKFWVALTVWVENGKVRRLTYLGRYGKSYPQGPPVLDPSEVDDPVENVKYLIRQLKQMYGSTFDKTVLNLGNGRSGGYIWKREKEIVFYFHSPFALWEKEGFLFQELHIHSADDVKFLNWLSEEIPGRPGDEKLWLDDEDE
jgi:hypothetical protein